MRDLCGERRAQACKRYWQLLKKLNGGRGVGKGVGKVRRTNDKKNMSLNSVKAPKRNDILRRRWELIAKATRENNTHASVNGKLPPE